MGCSLLFAIDQYEFQHPIMYYISIHNFDRGTHGVTNISLQISFCYQQNWGVGLQMRLEVFNDTLETEFLLFLQLLIPQSILHHSQNRPLQIKINMVKKVHNFRNNLYIIQM